ncbi:MAG: type II CRISPR-associated endonuclease Cas1 [Betaproteobacteria bacterium]|nr:type II CRISPR-associated endonuclease Cas1 [Betaproteobacteria bacterium]
MVWRSVVISQPAKLKREHFSLVVEQSQSARVPFEDIAVIVLNHREITLTHPVLSACGEYGIGLFSTGDNHQPNGVFIPYLSHTRGTRMLRLQLDIDRPTAKRAWAEIVKLKIANQATCLRLAGKEGWDRLESCARRVRSGDSENMEAQASSFYFPQLFGARFNRALDGWVNAALDYGYAVLRGAIARGLVAHGLMPSIGLFHRSEQNAFNLADDLIEPFRPLVDLHVVKHRPAVAEETAQLAPSDKVALVSLLNADMRMPRGDMTVLAAIEQAIEALVRLFDDGAESVLELPRLIGLRQHRIEA